MDASIAPAADRVPRTKSYRRVTAIMPFSVNLASKALPSGESPLIEQPLVRISPFWTNRLLPLEREQSKASNASSLCHQAAQYASYNLKC